MAEEALILPASWQASNDAPWHDPVWQQVSTVMLGDRLPQGLLLLGAEGVGKLAFARRIAMAAQCSKRHSQTQQACGQCDDCQQIAAGTHPDLCLMLPPDGKRSISVEAVRNFSHRLYLTAQKGKSRVGIISPAEAMTESAANALLKTLEEPPTGVTIILLASRISGLSATIRSRCQILKMPSPALSVASDWLADCLNIEQALVKEALLFQGPYALYEQLSQADSDAETTLPTIGQAMHNSLQQLQRASVDCVAEATVWRADGQPGLENRLQWLFEACATELRTRLVVADTGVQSRPLQGLSLTSLLDLPKRCMTTKRELQTQVNEQSLIEIFLLVLHRYLRSGNTV